MPLLDHFQPSFDPEATFPGFLSNWSTRLADDLTAALPPDHIAEELPRWGEKIERAVASGGGDPPPAHVLPFVFADSYEVLVYSTLEGRRLVGAIELVSPSNKGSLAERRAFATKVVCYLHAGASVMVVDIVTSAPGNLHNVVMRLLEGDSAAHLPWEVSLYAVSYCPMMFSGEPGLAIWPERLTIGGTLPTLPLYLRDDLYVQVDLDATYQEACRRRRLA